MSKNVQMQAIIGESRATVGAAAAAQGVYGSRGNLELVACDAADGLWVFWFNSDHDSDPVAAADVPPGTWSAGLHFAAGSRYTAAQILQSPLGPDHLEVLALTDGGALESWYWSPGPAFQRRAVDAARDVVRFDAAIAADGALTIDYEELGGCHRRATADAAGYPDRAWHTERAKGPYDSDADGELRAAGIRDFEAGTARVTVSTRDGGTREFTFRDLEGRLVHYPVPLG